MSDSVPSQSEIDTQMLIISLESMQQVHNMVVAHNTYKYNYWKTQLPQPQCRGTIPVAALRCLYYSLGESMQQLLAWWAYSQTNQLNLCTCICKHCCWNDKYACREKRDQVKRESDTFTVGSSIRKNNHWRIGNCQQLLTLFNSYCIY